MGTSRSKQIYFSGRYTYPYSELVPGLLRAAFGSFLQHWSGCGWEISRAGRCWVRTTTVAGQQLYLERMVLYYSFCMLHLDQLVETLRSSAVQIMWTLLDTQPNWVQGNTAIAISPRAVAGMLHCDADATFQQYLNKALSVSRLHVALSIAVA